MLSSYTEGGVEGIRKKEEMRTIEGIKKAEGMRRTQYRSDILGVEGGDRPSIKSPIGLPEARRGR